MEQAAPLRGLHHELNAHAQCGTQPVSVEGLAQQVHEARGLVQQHVAQRRVARHGHHGGQPCDNTGDEMTSQEGESRLTKADKVTEGEWERESERGDREEEGERWGRANLVLEDLRSRSPRQTVDAGRAARPRRWCGAS